MKAYKGFNKDMTCRGFQYEEGKEYECGKASLCNKGFHACENPLDCYSYYTPGESVYHEVEIEDNGERHPDDTKVVGKKIKIGAALSIADICKAHFEYVSERCIPSDSNVAGDNESASAGYSGSASAGNSGSASAGYSGSASAGYRGSASAGNRGSASAGYSGSASAGYRGSASAGEYGSASAGNSGSASAGYSGSASAGNRGSASAGNRGSASAGNRGSASAGEYGSASSRGCISLGKDGIGAVRCTNPKAKGDIGSILLLAKEKASSYDLVSWKVIQIDGEKYKANTWYTIKDDQIVEAGDDEHE